MRHLNAKLTHLFALAPISVARNAAGSRPARNTLWGFLAVNYTAYSRWIVRDSHARGAAKTSTGRNGK